MAYPNNVRRRVGGTMPSLVSTDWGSERQQSVNTTQTHSLSRSVSETVSTNTRYGVANEMQRADGEDEVDAPIFTPNPYRGKAGSSAESVSDHLIDSICDGSASVSGAEGSSDRKETTPSRGSRFGLASAPVKLPSHMERHTDSDETLYTHSNMFRCSWCHKETHNMRYCIQCSKYLCLKCKGKAEHGPQGKREHHTLVEISTKSMSTQMTAEKCESHPGRIIKFFCKDHCCLCCDKCECAGHSKCSTTSVDKLDNKDMVALKQRTKGAVHRNLHKMIERRNVIKERAASITQKEETMKKQIQESAQEMISYIKRLEQKLLGEVEKTFGERRNECSDSLKQCENYINKFTRYAQTIEQPKLSAETTLTKLERLKKIERHLAEDEKIVESALEESTDLSTINCVFEVNKALLKDLKDTECIGSVVFQVVTVDRQMSSHLDETQVSSCSEDYFEPISVKEYSFLTTWVARDLPKLANIACMKVLHDDTILICDIASCRIKRFERSGALKFLEAVGPFQTRPWFIDRLTRNKYIVTFPDGESFSELTVENGKLSMGTTVCIGGPYAVCSVIEDTIVFVQTEKPHFLTTDLHGANGHTTFSKATEKSFQRPNYILYSDETKLLYVNDPDTGVFGINMQRKDIVFKYEKCAPLCPLELSFGKDGHLLVICNQTRNIQCISKYDGEFRYVITLEDLPTGHYAPQCICFLPRADEYLVSFTESFEIIRFRIGSD